MSSRTILMCSIAALSVLAPSDWGRAQTVPGETANCRLKGTPSIRFRDESPERNSAECLATCLSYASNLADPNRCTGYNFVVNNFSTITGYLGPIVVGPDGKPIIPDRACALLKGALSFGDSNVAADNYSCILPCNGPPQPCGLHPSPPQSVGITPDNPAKALDPANPALRGPKAVPKGDALVKDNPGKDLDPNSPGLELPPVRKPPR